MTDWNLRTKEERHAIRGAMLEEVVKQLSEQQPESPQREIRKAAAKLVNVAIFNERAANRRARQRMN